MSVHSFIFKLNGYEINYNIISITHFFCHEGA